MAKIEVTSILRPRRRKEMGVATCRMSRVFSIKGFVSLLRLSFVIFSATLAAAAQCTSADREEMAMRTSADVSRIGAADVGSAPTWIMDLRASPCQHPDVYWHDKDWNIDLLRPSRKNDPFSVRIRSRAGQERTVKLDDSFDQVASILLAPNDEAIVVAYVYGSWSGEFSVATIVDLKTGNSIDKVVAFSFSISPNRRFLVYLNGDQTDPVYDYRLYDVLRTPRENTCAYRDNDPEHKDFDEENRGVPLYPKSVHQVFCSEADQKPFENENHRSVSNFLWSTDSSKVIFADAKNESTLSILLVKMPTGPRDYPSTSIYRSNAAQVPRLGSMNSNKELIHLSWAGDSDEAVSILSDDPDALTIQLSKFFRLD